MKVKVILQIALGIAAVILAYLIYESIMKPVRFNNERARREEVIVQQLKNIRTAEIAYKDVYKRYCSDMDSLILFLNSGRIPTIKMIGDVPDTLTEAEALKRKLISRDTVYGPAFDALFPEKVQNKQAFLDNLAYVPFSNKESKFLIETGFVTRSNIQMPVIMVSCPFNSYLHDLDPTLVRNLASQATDLNKFPGLKFGSIDENITEGNWE